MNLEDIIKKLESLDYCNNAAKTQIDLYSTIKRTQLASQSNRLNAGWARGKYVIARIADDSNNDESHLQFLIQSWCSKVKDYENQYLILEVTPGDWKCFDYNGNLLGGNEYIINYCSDMSGNNTSQNKTLLDNSKYPLQRIVFGAPGTGKSHSIKNDPNINEKNTLRTIFHPDSDYSTFVGCYKPTKKTFHKQPLMATEDLIEKASAVSGVANQVQFLCDNAESIVIAADEKQVTANKLVWDSFKWHNETYFVSILNSLLAERKKYALDEITYDFCPQAFINAYVKAWQNPDTPIFLIIEEINRGDCAQIFGDIFQLLDRDENGFSRYKIAPDSDLQQYLSNAFKNTEIVDNAIKNGISMQLPNNLYLWATMNTSDQSLFPIDSAFKRRWEWKYLPIDYTDRGHYISCKGKKYSWADFLLRVNEEVEVVTQSEDKKLGYWFTGNSASQLEISADKFVSKVIFFLWNDVFKDFGHNAKTIFKNDYAKFHFFFDYTGNIKEEVLEHFLHGLELKPVGDKSTDSYAEDKPDSETTAE